jgi:hypothetical protein
MDADKKPSDSTAPADQASPAGSGPNPPSSDALGKPTDVQATGDLSPGSEGGEGAAKPAKKLSPLKKVARRFNVYLILFMLLLIIGGVITAVAYLNGKKAPPAPAIANQTLTPAQLKQLANSNATVGGSGQTLPVQGNAVFSGNVLVRNSLNVAGSIQLGGQLSLPQLNVTSSANLAGTQINNLQVSGAAIFQSMMTLQNGLTAGGNFSFTGTLTVGTLTASKIVMSNNALLTVPNHVSFTGTAPHIGQQSVGGGTVSVTGSDTNGTVTITTGGGGSGGCMVTLNFNQPFSSTPHVLISPINAAAGGIEFYATRTTTSFSICSAIAAPSNQQLAFSYFITD